MIRLRVIRPNTILITSQLLERIISVLNVYVSVEHMENPTSELCKCTIDLIDELREIRSAQLPGGI
jgi:hypothetical protein